MLYLSAPASVRGLGTVFDRTTRWYCRQCANGSNSCVPLSPRIIVMWNPNNARRAGRMNVVGPVTEWLAADLPADTDERRSPRCAWSGWPYLVVQLRASRCVPGQVRDARPVGRPRARRRGGVLTGARSPLFWRAWPATPPAAAPANGSQIATLRAPYHPPGGDTC